MENGTPQIIVKDLVKSYGSQRVLHGVSLEQARGEDIVIIGPSGCGKSTFLRCLNQLETFDSGSITVAGITIDPAHSGHGEQVRQLRIRAGMVFQQFNLFPHMTVVGNVMEAPVTVKGMRSKDAEVLAMDLLKKVGLAEKAKFYPSQLSGGQQQRVAIARA